MKPGKIRPLALFVVLHQNKILVEEGYDFIKEQKFYRPLGGRIRFGELGVETAAREIFEEIQAQVEDIQYLGTLENLFTYNGEEGHEIVLVYTGKLSNKDFYRNSIIRGQESDGEPITAVWMPLNAFFDPYANSENQQPIPLYPDGLLNLVIETHG